MVNTQYLEHTVEPPCATTSHKRPPPISDRQSKTPRTVSKTKPYSGTSSKRPVPVSDREQFLGLKVDDFPLFLVSCKRPFVAFSDLYFRCVQGRIQDFFQGEGCTRLLLYFNTNKPHIFFCRIPVVLENRRSSQGGGGGGGGGAPPAPPPPPPPPRTLMCIMLLKMYEELK